MTALAPPATGLAGVSIVLPCHDEEANVAAAVRMAMLTGTLNALAYEVIVVDHDHLVGERVQRSRQHRHSHGGGDVGLLVVAGQDDRHAGEAGGGWGERGHGSSVSAPCWDPVASAQECLEEARGLPSGRRSPGGHV